MHREQALPVMCRLLPFAAALALMSGPVGAQVRLIQTNPMEITTDTPEYCHELMKRMSELLKLARAPVPHEVDDLTSEGRRMCDHGHTRGGIMRLRSALMLMEKDKAPAYR
jgi:hypothetical protein